MHPFIRRMQGFLSTLGIRISPNARANVGDKAEGTSSLSGSGSIENQNYAATSESHQGDKPGDAPSIIFSNQLSKDVLEIIATPGPDETPLTPEVSSEESKTSKP